MIVKYIEYNHNKTIAPSGQTDRDRYSCRYYRYSEKGVKEIRVKKTLISVKENHEKVFALAVSVKVVQNCFI